MRIILLVFLSLFSVLTFAEDEESVMSDWEVTKMPYTHQNIQVPRELWSTIKKILKDDGHHPSVIDGFSIYPTVVDVDFSYLDHPRVIKNKKKQRLIFKEGGGEVDLFNIITGKGKFKMRFAPHLVNGKEFHILYISDSPGKKIREDQWGNGCGNIFDLSDEADRFLGEEGVLLTTSKRHYLHFLAGTFIFFQLVDDRLYLGYIRLKDSRYPQFVCKQKKI